MCLDIIVVCISFLEDSLIFQIDPQVFFDGVEIYIALDVIEHKFVLSAEEKLDDFAFSGKLSLQLTVVVEVPHSQQATLLSTN